ncbi:enoyl-CoA hydratase [Brevibacillus sp. SYP-B805]|uniref:enoyl-CoA hydratase/isomerase family protein n=1 Tax=Brevibacillus sp. SYP-B805 TaxID=1578199 RepID=UPI0013EC4F29|nr:enoyl-CoA hydratase [Brevibacillus sp. SYP-B805]NGQ95777.1 enoyl-CoA hydratase [Brevibacillus sp. SYP-B805]
MNDQTISFDVRNHVATIVLNRPEAANAMNIDMAKALMHAAIECDSPNVRAVIITGSGNVFSVGGDLKSFSQQRHQLPSHLKEVTTYLHAAISRFSRMDAPVIAAVNGVAAGGGMSLAIACDIVIAAVSARFTMAYTKVGLTPDLAASYFLPRLVGFKRALDLVLTNRVLSAQEALDLGLVTKIVPDGEVLAQANEMAAQFAEGARTALGEAKRLLHSGWNESLETQMEKESQTIAKMAQTPEAIEGITAFLEKRKPDFLR